MSENRTELGVRLKVAREYLQLNQEEVAKSLNLPRSAISLIETGARKVEVMELKRLAELYQQPIGHFTGEQSAGAMLPEHVDHLARTASQLKPKDREELLRFAQFLQQRGKK